MDKKTFKCGVCHEVFLAEEPDRNGTNQDVSCPKCHMTDTSPAASLSLGDQKKLREMEEKKALEEREAAEALRHSSDW